MDIDVSSDNQIVHEQSSSYIRADGVNNPKRITMPQIADNGLGYSVMDNVTEYAYDIQENSLSKVITEHSVAPVYGQIEESDLIRGFGGGRHGAPMEVLKNRAFLEGIANLVSQYRVYHTTVHRCVIESSLDRFYDSFWEDVPRMRVFWFMDASQRKMSTNKKLQKEWDDQNGVLNEQVWCIAQNPTVREHEPYTTYMNRMLPSWDLYLTQYALISPTAPTAQKIKQLVEEEVIPWQQKGEFESTAEWQQRVNETTRKAKVQEITTRIQKEYNEKVQAYNDKVAKIKKDYESAYRQFSDMYCAAKAEEFAQQDFVLKPYDADNETYLISSAVDGDILLPVPKAKAQGFKADWDKIKKNASAVFVPTGNDVAIKSVKFGNYTYDGNTQANYAVTTIDYNFTPIEIAAVEDDFATIDVTPEVTVSNPTVKTISSKKVAPQNKKLVVGSASDVDLNIPKGKTEAKNTFAIVIANENYQNVERVENAANDGQVVAQYLTETLGIPQTQVLAYKDASFGNMIDALDRMKNIAQAYQGTNFNVIFYYAGHGVPDEQSHEAYLLPVDGKPGSSAVNIPLSRLYAVLGNLGASTVYVMLDACFSGAQRGDGMLAQARSVAIRAKAAEPQGNMVVLSAAQGDETAYPYQGKSHGLFTYYLLKKLQESSGNVTIGELSDYVIDNVKKTSVIENNGKIQTPMVRISYAVGEGWRSQKLVK